MGASENVEVYRAPWGLSERELELVTSLICQVLKEQGSKGHPLKGTPRFPQILQAIYLLDCNGHLEKFRDKSNKLVGVLAWDIGVPWWTDQKCLEEVFVYCLDPDLKGFGRIALKRLDELAGIYGCSFIETGGAACVDQKPLENLYMKKGDFTFSYQKYIKRMEGGSHGKT